MRIKIGLVDYNTGNLGTLKTNLNKLGFRCVISNDRTTLHGCDVLLLPGVGAFPDAMIQLQETKLDQFLIEEAHNNKPIVGICLGMQILAQSSVENGYHAGLGIFPYDVEALPSNIFHIGWNSISLSVKGPSFFETKCEEFFFNHKYAVMNAEKYQICTSEIHGHTFVAALRYKNVVGLQFHPEKSQQAGRLLIKKVIRDLINV